jgi:hypothetical protein
LAALGCGLFFAASGEAATIYEYNFSQGRYSGNMGTFAVTGQFSGTLDNGFITGSTLTSFSFLGLNSPPASFSFNVNGGGSTLNLTFQLSTDAFHGQAACLGAPAVSGGVVGVVNCGGGSYNGIYYTFSPVSAAITQDVPEVTLVRIITEPLATGVPEPGTFMLFAAAVILVVAGTRRARVSGFGSARASPEGLSLRLVAKARPRGSWFHRYRTFIFEA